MNYYLFILSSLLLSIWGLWQYLDGDRDRDRSQIGRWGMIGASTAFLTIGLNPLTSPLVSLILASIVSCSIASIDFWGSQLQLPRTTKQQRIWSIVSTASIITAIGLWQWADIPDLVKIGLTVICLSIAVMGLMTTWIRLRSWVITGIVTASLVGSFQIQGIFTPAAFAANQNFVAGAYIVDMGQTTQTIANGLKPYGLIFDLVINQGIPVIWAINPSKVQDGLDFTANGKNYSGSAFIIAPEFAASAAATINTWKTKGVIVDGPLATGFTAPIFNTITSFPNAVLDLANGLKIAGPYYTNAGIPASSTGVFGTFNAYRQGDPSSLTSCDDIFILPHADPTWANHNYLLPFNQTKGYLWVGCHAGSVLENLYNPSNSTTTPQMNFLSAANGLVPYTSHTNGSPPYTYTPPIGSTVPYQWSVADPVDPIMQFIGTLDAATQNGSEQIYLPRSTGWRSTTKVAVYDSSQANVPALSPGPAAVVAYGRGFENSTNGMVMYEGGHNLNGFGTASVAAERAFFNFLLLAGIERRPTITTNIPNSITSGTTVNVSATGGNTYKWASDCGGSFANDTLGSTTFTAPSITANSTCNLRVAITDNCNRRNFASNSSIITPPNINIEGTVRLDATGVNSTFASILTTQPGANVNPAINAILVNSAGNVVATTPVVNNGTAATNGTYTLSTTGGQNGLYVMLSNSTGTIGQAAPSPSLPASWTNTAPLTYGAAVFNLGTTDIIGKDFAIEQLPTAIGGSSASQANPTGTGTASVPASLFTGSTDPDGTVTAYKIITFPGNAASITINGVNYTSTIFPSIMGVTINTAQLVGMVVDPIDGAVTVDIPFRAIDNAGKISTNTATANLVFSTASSTSISISGIVWDDRDNSANGTFNNIQTGAEIGTNAIFGTTNIPLNAILLDATGNVVATQLVGDGTNGNTVGAYSFSNLPQNTNVQVIISPIAGTIGSASPLAAAPTGWMNTSPASTGIFNTGLYSQIKNFGIRQKAKVILAKRITQINGLTINPNDRTNLANVTADTHNHANNWADKYLVGSINGGLVKPGDKIQYTIYFLNHQGTNAINVNICDPILGNQTYVPNTIELQLGNTTTATSLTDIIDSDDRANYYPVGATPIKCNVSVSGVNGTNNAGIAIGITGTGATKQPDLPVIPGAIGIGTPIESYGLFRFTTQIDY